MVKASLLDKMSAYLSGKIAYHEANLEVYFNNPAGIGEHPDILQAIESELGKLAEYQEKLVALENLNVTEW
jgi:hypothetical protein